MSADSTTEALCILALRFSEGDEESMVTVANYFEPEYSISRCI